MENKKTLGIVGLVVLCLAVSALFGIAYATFTQDLTIGGSATVGSQSWKVAWSSISNNATNTHGATGTLPTISQDGVTSITNWTASFTEPGQSYAFDVTAKNYGDFPAKLTAFTQGSLTCAPADTNGASAAKATAVCSNMTLVVKDSTGAVLTAPSSNTLAKNTGTETYTFILSYNQDQTDTDGSSLPDGTVDVTVGTSTFTYTQQ